MIYNKENNTYEIAGTDSSISRAFSGNRVVPEDHSLVKVVNCDIHRVIQTAKKAATSLNLPSTKKSSKSLSYQPEIKYTSREQSASLAEK